MIIEALALFITYSGMRCYETCRTKNYNKRHLKEGALFPKLEEELIKKNTIATIPSNDSPSPPTKTKTEIIDPHKNIFGISIITLGLTIIRVYVPVISPIMVGFIIYNGLFPLKKAEFFLRKKKVTHETVVSVIYFSGLWFGQYIPVAIGGVFYQLGVYLSTKAQKSTEKNLSTFCEQVPTTAWIITNEVEIEVSTNTLKAQDIVVVSMGNMIPVDGDIYEGEGIVDQRALTGESQPVEKVTNDSVFAGTFLVAGKIFVEVRKSGVETSLAKINNILEQTVHFKSKNQLRGEKLANLMATPLLIASGATYFLFGPVAMQVVLNSTVGNLTSVIGSVGTLSHLNSASEANILIKDGQGLEALNDIDTVLFDKTGTLTEEVPTLTRIIRVDDRFEENDILKYVAAAEQKLSHPIAQAFSQAAKERRLTLPPVDDASYQLGRGIRVTIEQNIIEVGSHCFMQEENMSIPPFMQDIIEETHEMGTSLVFIAMNHKIIAAIELRATVRPEVKGIIKALREMGINHLAIVSGDHQHPTENLARQLQMDDCFYEVLPEEKANIVEKLQQQGKKVCFIGDGINDTIAMKKANVSISLKGASSIATNAAQIVLMDGTLRKLPTVFTISRQFNTNLRNNLNLMLLPLGINIIAVYTVGLSLMTAISIKNIIFFWGLKRTVKPTLELPKK